MRSWVGRGTQPWSNNNTPYNFQNYIPWDLGWVGVHSREVSQEAHQVVGGTQGIMGAGKVSRVTQKGSLAYFLSKFLYFLFF